VAIFAVTKAQQLNVSPYGLLKELVELVKRENFQIDHSLLIVSVGRKRYLFGDNCLVDLVSTTGVPRFTHTLSV